MSVDEHKKKFKKIAHAQVNTPRQRIKRIQCFRKAFIRRPQRGSQGIACPYKRNPQRGQKEIKDIVLILKQEPRWNMLIAIGMIQRTWEWLKNKSEAKEQNKQRG